MFGIILNYLRTDILEDISSKNDLKKLQLEAEYFEIKELQQAITKRLSFIKYKRNYKLNKITFVIHDEEGKQASQPISAQVSLFGKTPIQAIVFLFETNPEFSFKAYDDLKGREFAKAKSDILLDKDGNVVIRRKPADYHPDSDTEFDSDGNMLLEIYESDAILNIVNELKTKNYQSDLAKAFVFLREIIYADDPTTKVDFMVGEKRFECKKSCLVRGDQRIIIADGKLLGRNKRLRFKADEEPLLCVGNRKRNECPCSGVHETTMKVLVNRILGKLEKSRIVKRAPVMGTQSWEDSCDAQDMAILDDWFYDPQDYYYSPLEPESLNFLDSIRFKS